MLPRATAAAAAVRRRACEGSLVCVDVVRAALLVFAYNHRSQVLLVVACLSSVHVFSTTTARGVGGRWAAAFLRKEINHMLHTTLRLSTAPARPSL